MRYRQLAFLIMLVYPAYKITSLPSYFVGVSGQDAWISFLVMCSLDLMTLWLIMTVKRRGGVATLIGRTPSKVLMLAVGLFGLLQIALLSVPYTNYVTDVLFDHDRKSAIILPFMCIAAYCGLSGCRSIGRVADVTGPVLILTWLLTALFNTAEPDLSRLQPILDGDVFAKLTAGASIAFCFGDFLPLLFIEIKDDSKNEWRVYVSAAISMIVVGVMYVTFIAMYGMAGEIVNNAYARLISYNILTPEVGRFDWLGIAILLIRTLLRSGVDCYVTFRAIKALFGQIVRDIFLVAVIVGVWVTVITLNSVSTVYQVMTSLCIPVTLLIYGVPIILSVLSMVRGRKDAKEIII